MIADTIVHKYLENVAAQPDQLILNFIEDGNETAKTLAECFAKSSSISQHLLKESKKGDRALLLYPPGIDFFEAFWACQFAGFIAVPVPLTMDMDQVQNSLIHIHKDCEASVLLTHSSLVAIIEYQKSKNPERSSPDSILATDSIDEKVITSEEIKLPDLQDISILQYTSGSVSQPKGVVLSHQNVASNLNIIDSYTRISTMNNGCGWMPHFHDMGLIGQFLFPALIPGPFHFISPMAFIQNPLVWLKMVTRYRSNIIAAPNFAFELCNKYISEEAKEQLDLSTIEVALTGSEPIQADVLNRFAENFASCGFDAKAFMPCYGMAETTLMVYKKNSRLRYNS